MRHVLLAGLLAHALAAQVATHPHHVLVRGSAPTLSQVYAVDPLTGSAQSVGALPSAALAPLALARDPVDGHLIAAFDLGSNQSRIARLTPSPGGWLESSMAVVPGVVVAVEVAGDSIYAAVDGPNGGVFRLPRRGGPAQMVLAQPNLTAIEPLAGNPQILVLAWTGRPATAAVDSGTAVYDLAQGQYLFGPDTFANPTGRVTTGVLDLPTAVPRQLLAFDDGSFAVFSGVLGGGPQPVAIAPPLPAGAATAMHQAGPYSVQGVAVGGASHPFLYAVDPWTASVQVLSQALPGEPVDFAFGLPLAANSSAFGARCGAVSLQQGWTSLAQPGAVLASTVQTDPGLLLWIAAGLDDFAAGVLPAPLPGACLLQVRPDFVAAAVSDAAGTAVQAFAIPAQPTLFGTVLFTQWAHFGASGFSVSAGAAHRIGS